MRQLDPRGTGGIPELGDEHRDPSDPAADGALDDGGPLSGVVLIAGTDFSTLEVAAIDLATGDALGRTTLTSGDSALVSSDGRGFVLDRTAGALVVLSPTGTLERRIDLSGGDAAPTYLNAHDSVVVPGGSKAYVSLFDKSAVVVVDVDAGTVIRTISFASLLDPSDTDGSVDVDRGFYDPVSKRAYFAAHRVNVNDLFSAPYLLHCPPVPSLLVAVDTETDTVADL